MGARAPQAMDRPYPKRCRSGRGKDQAYMQHCDGRESVLCPGHLTRGLQKWRMVLKYEASKVRPHDGPEKQIYYFDTMLVTFAYAGPVIASIAFNVGGAAVATVCVYLYLHRDRFKRNKVFLIFTKPFHGLVKKIAITNLKKVETKKFTRERSEGKKKQRQTPEG